MFSGVCESAHVGDRAWSSLGVRSPRGGGQKERFKPDET